MIEPKIILDSASHEIFSSHKPSVSETEQKEVKETIAKPSETGDEKSFFYRAAVGYVDFKLQASLQHKTDFSPFYTE